MTKLVLWVVVIAALAVFCLAKPRDKSKQKTKKIKFNGKELIVPDRPKEDPFKPRLATDEEDDILPSEGDESDGRKKRKAVLDSRRFWPEAIVPHQFGEEERADNAYVTKIKSAMAEWEDKTCITFPEWNQDLANTLGHNQRIRYTLHNTSCSSYVGRQSEGFILPQPVKVKPGCSYGSIVHEIGHAVGFFHEHVRPDRDQHVEIKWDNIKEGKERNFKIKNVTEVTGGETVEYDPSSVMHYGAGYFAIDTSKPTIRTLDPKDAGNIGQRNGLSFLDAKLANIHYNCSDHCTNGLSCQNGGYVNKDCACTCPDGWSGDLCADPVAEDGQDYLAVTLTDQAGEIQSPGYPNNNYTVNQARLWILQGNPADEITVTFDAFNLEDSTTECYDYVQINIDDPQVGGQKYCGSNSPGVVTATGVLGIRFYSDDLDVASGFHAHYTIAPVGPSPGDGYNWQTTKSIGWDNGVYPNGFTAHYDFNVSPGYKFIMWFDEMDLEDDPACAKDYVELVTGEAVSPKLCGRNQTNLGYYESTGNTWKLIFRSNNSNNYKGWLLKWRTAKI